MSQSESFGDYLLRSAEPEDLPTRLPIRPLATRARRGVTTPHEGHEQFGIIDLLDSDACDWVIFSHGGFIDRLRV